MKTTLVTEIIIGLIAILGFVLLYDVIAKRRGAGESFKTRLELIIANKVVYRILSISLTVLILYLSYTLFFK